MPLRCRKSGGGDEFRVSASGQTVVLGGERDSEKCPCPSCQRRSPHYPWLIRSVPREGQLPSRFYEFYRDDFYASRDVVDNWAPVYEFRQLTHDQVIEMYGE